MYGFCVALAPGFLEDFTPDLALQKQHWRLEVSGVVSSENSFFMDLGCVTIKGLVPGMCIRGCLLSWNTRVVKYGNKMTAGYCEDKKFDILVEMS